MSDKPYRSHIDMMFGRIRDLIAPEDRIEYLDPDADTPWREPNFQVRIEGTTEEFAYEHHQNRLSKIKHRSDPWVITAYTDGSQDENGTGAGLIYTQPFPPLSLTLAPLTPPIPTPPHSSMILPHHLVKKAMLPLGTTAEVFDAELSAIEAVLRKIKDIPLLPPHTHIRVFSDSQAALQREHYLHATPGQFLTRKIWQHCDSLHKQRCTVKLEWIRGHCDIPGNETADLLAKEAARSKPPNNPSTSLTHLKRRIRSKLLKEWKSFFNDYPHGNSYMGTPTLTLPNELRSKNRILTSQIIQLRTGHGYFKAYYRRFNLQIPNYICACGSTNQTPAHLLLTCPKFHQDRPRYRTHIRGPPNIKDVLHDKDNMKKLVTFLEDTSIATRHWFQNVDRHRAESEDLATWANYGTGLGNLNLQDSQPSQTGDDCAIQQSTRTLTTYPTPPSPLLEERATSARMSRD